MITRLPNGSQTQTKLLHAPTRVLIVAGDRLVAQDHIRRLESLGYPAPATALSIEQAISVAAEFHPHVVVVDNAVPLLDQAGSIPTLHEHLAVPLVFLTEPGTPQVESLGHLAKPFTDRELQLALEAVLYRDRWSDLAAIISSSTDAIIQLNVDGLITSWNPGAARLFGYTEEEAIGQHAKLLVPTDRQHEIQTKLARLAAGETVPPHETVRLRKDGSAVAVNITAMPIRGLDGDIIGYAGIMRDITQLQELREQFRQAQKMEAVGILAGGVAHDFNNLVTVVNGNCQLLLEDLPLHDPCRDAVIEIHEAVNRTSSLTRQLLAFSRRQSLEPVVLSLNDIVLGARRFLQRLIGANIHIETQLDASIGHVLADPGQLEQVLLNLAVNARDAMPNGGRLILETANAAANRVRLSVTDTGSGMPADVQKRIFEPFFTTKAPGVGTGLGLSVVHGFVSQSGGAIAVRSSEGVGTRFDIELPAVEKPMSLPLHEDIRSSASANGVETILIVEDDAGVRRVTSRSLQAEGYNVLEAASGEDADRVALRFARRIDLLVTDVMLPDTSGVELLNTLQHRHADLKVLFISGYTAAALTKHGIASNESNYLPKPFSPQTLAQKVRDILDASPNLSSPVEFESFRWQT